MPVVILAKFMRDILSNIFSRFFSISLDIFKFFNFFSFLQPDFNEFSESPLFLKTVIGCIVLIAIIAIAYGVWKWIDLQRQQKHWMNILGTVHNLKIPKQEILTMQQWNEHKKSATHQSLPEFICNYLKFNVVAMNIKLKPAAQDTVSANMASPIGPSTMPQATNVQLDVFVLEQPTEEIHAKAE